MDSLTHKTTEKDITNCGKPIIEVLKTSKITRFVDCPDCLKKEKSRDLGLHSIEKKE